MAENYSGGWYTGAHEIIIVVSSVCVCVWGWYKIEEMCGGIMRPITEMGCKYGQDSQGSDVLSAHFIRDCSAGAKWQPVPHQAKGKWELAITVLYGDVLVWNDLSSFKGLFTCSQNIFFKKGRLISPVTTKHFVIHPPNMVLINQFVGKLSGL